ncbi:MAG: lipopolysaccharide biosynthesis protein [Bacteroidaceae bacterium]|nr:lipopolysaccharide biosynthesis protein [Bacteroidaceae bacterium]
MAQNLNKQVATATKWSAVTELAAKLVLPITTMILARILTPEAFGVLVTATMIISFAEIFTDAGFQKYLVQKEFKDNKKLYDSTAVAFWSNLILSLIIWAFIAIFSPLIAHWIGNDGGGLVIAVSCVCIPLAAFSSIQMALFRRNFDFRTLFIVRMAGIMVPIVVTIPLAYLTRSYWALIIGMITQNLTNAVILTWKSEWKPRWYYSFTLFREMFSFTMWSMVEAISIWLTGYLDVFIVGIVLSTYYMGIYRTSITTVGQITTLITSATTPILFSALSRLQDNPQEFKEMFFRFQKLVSIFVIPLGVGIFLFSNLITTLLLGEQWKDAANFIGWWGLTSAIIIVLSFYCSEVYRAKGKPKLSVLSQFLHIAFLIPTVLIFVQYDFSILCIARSCVRLTAIVIDLTILYCITHISPKEMWQNIHVSVLAALGMAAFATTLPSTDNTLIQLGYVILCSSIYFAIIMLFPKERNIILRTKSQFFKKNIINVF